MSQYANLTNLPTKGVDLSAVTQAASGPMFNQGGQNGTTSSPTLPSGGGSNPSTSLYNAGTPSQTGSNLANFATNNGGQKSIAGPGPGQTGYVNPNTTQGS